MARWTRGKPPVWHRLRHPVRRLLGGWSLRTRLIAALVGLLALVSVVVGVVSTLALRDLLVGQLDSQLQAAGNRASHAYQQRPPPEREAGERDEPGPDFLDAPGQPAGTLGAQLRPGSGVQAGVIDEAGNRQPVPTAIGSILVDLPADGEPHTRDLGTLGTYRLLATNTSRGETLVTGLPLSGVTETVWRMTAMAAAVAVIGLLAVGALGAIVVRKSLRPLRRVAATATRVAEMPLDRGEVALSIRVPLADTDPRTEVGQVGSALNRLLGHVSAALAARHESEMRVRQFVADASHELRTPLAAIRGYAEVTRRNGDAVPPDVAHALRRVESETVRMTALVEDLLLLARLDAGRPLAADPVDLTSLIVDAVSDAHVAGPGHRWLLDLPEDPVTVTGDAARLHQVFANLLANAHAHTPPGTSVTTSLTSVDGTAVVTVADDGPGVPPELLPEVFERFARGDTSRSRAAGSTGLGLAIVFAVVEAHHGETAVESRSGRTAFTVTLPRHADEAEPNGSPQPVQSSIT
jgi:two-component system, OmpR family, sensor kinase